MFSGKTSLLINECRKWNKIDKKVLIVNYLDDVRTDNLDEDAFLYSHNLEKEKCVKVKILKDVNKQELENADMIAINEGQFFEDLKEFCLLWCEKYGKSIIVCGLDGDFEREKMGQILDLIPICDDVIKMKALCVKCKDGTSGIFSKRLSDNNSKIEIGNNYIPVCRQHYI
jgi:thymidine kinase